MCLSQGMPSDPEARRDRGILGCGGQPSIVVTNCLREQEETSLGSPSRFSVRGGQLHCVETQGKTRASQKNHVFEEKCSNIGIHRAEQEERPGDKLYSSQHAPSDTLPPLKPCYLL